MSKNLHQIFLANPATAMAATDEMYLIRSPFGVGDDMGITWANILASIAAQASGTWGISISGNAATATTTTTATTATNATNIGTTAVSTNASFYPLFVSSNAGGNQAADLGTGLTFNPSTNTLTTTTFVGALTGNASTATSATTATTATNANNVATTQVSTNASFFPLFVASSTNGNQAVDLGTGLSFNPSTNTLTTTTFSGALNGNATTASNAMTWNDVAGTTQAAAVNNGYVISNASQTTVTLPATSAVGARVAVQGKGAAGWVLTANTGQVVHLGNTASSTAGSLTSTNLWDCIEVVCVTANTTWAANSVIGNITVA